MIHNAKLSTQSIVRFHCKLMEMWNPKLAKFYRDMYVRAKFSFISNSVGFANHSCTTNYFDLQLHYIKLIFVSPNIRNKAVKLLHVRIQCSLTYSTLYVCFINCNLYLIFSDQHYNSTVHHYTRFPIIP